MSEEDAKLFGDFETKLRHLVYLHSKLKDENAKLKQRLSELEDALEKQQSEYQRLDKDYTDLRNGLAISMDGGDIKATKKKLAKLVREVDQCIAMITE